MKSRFTTEWTPEMIAHLVAARKAGQFASVTAKEINAKFGTRLTKNAILGKAHRLELHEKQAAAFEMAERRRKFIGGRQNV